MNISDVVTYSGRCLGVEVKALDGASNCATNNYQSHYVGGNHLPTKIYFREPQFCA